MHQRIKKSLSKIENKKDVHIISKYYE